LLEIFGLEERSSDGSESVLESIDTGGFLATCRYLAPPLVGMRGPPSDWHEPAFQASATLHNVGRPVLTSRGVFRQRITTIYVAVTSNGE